MSGTVLKRGDKFWARVMVNGQRLQNTHTHTSAMQSSGLAGFG